MLLNGNEQAKSAYWQFNLSRDVLYSPITLRMHSEDVKRKDFCIPHLHPIACSIDHAPPRVYNNFPSLPKTNDKKNLHKDMLASAWVFQPNIVEHASIVKLQQWLPYGLVLTVSDRSEKCAVFVKSFLMKCSSLKMPRCWEWKWEQERVFIW